jgi:fibronectin type 3 domain-containing protein
MPEIMSAHETTGVYALVSAGNGRVVRPKRRIFGALAALSMLVYAPCKADVPTPPAPAPVPAGSYCSSIYSELNGDLQAFNTVLTTPPSWTPIPLPAGASTLYGGNLAWANSNTGPSISSPSYLQTVVQPQLQAMQAMGIQAVSVPVLFPILYEPFYGSAAAMAPYTAFYKAVAQAVRAAGLKLIIDDEILFSNDTAAGWTNMNAFYGSLTWSQYVAARAQMAAVVEQTMLPDYLMLANEPDTEALQTGQPNLNIPADAADMVAAEVAAVQAVVQAGNLSPVPQLGAGFGTWMPATGTPSLMNYIDAYDALPLDYIDFHLLPINSVNNSNFLNNSLTVASMAASVGKPVAVSQAWPTKEKADEWDVLSADLIRTRGYYGFWAPLDAYFLQTAQALANYTQMLYLVPQFPTDFYAYQPYGGTTANGGAANCTCTTASCSAYDIYQTENQQAADADEVSVYTPTAVSYYHQLVTTPDTTPPTVPAALAGKPGTTTAALSWEASTDNVGVAGYNVYRCSPAAAGQACTEVWIANSTLPSFDDTTLTPGTSYNYQVQAFDFVNNNSPLSKTLSLQTFITSADSATNLVATAVSAQAINLTWSAPATATGLGEYKVYGGTSPSNLQQIVIATPTTTAYTNQPLSGGTTYYYGIVAMEEGIAAPMTPIASATTLPLPNPPNSVAAAPAPTAVTLTWQENPQPNGLPIAFYQIYQGATPGRLALAGSATSAKYMAQSLSPNTTYYFEIEAQDTGHDVSMPSNQISVTTSPMPAAPASVVATANAATMVTITWSENIPANGLPIASYNIFRGTSPTGMTNLAARTTPQYIDTAASASTTYYYATQAVDTGGDLSPMSAAVQVVTPAMPAAPASVAPAANSATQVTITWSENIPANGLPISSYNIFRGTSPTSLTNLAARTGPLFIDTTASPSTTYYYAIQAVDSGNDVSPMSATAKVTTPPMPAAPAGVASTANSATQVTVTWSESIPPSGLPVQYYFVFRGTSPTGLAKLATKTGLQFIDTAASPSTTYYYAIESVDTGNDVSPMSATTQAVTFPMPAAPASVAPTANSATQVTITWSENIPADGLAISSYNIFRGTSSTALTKLAARTGPLFIDTAASASTTYYYAIQAVDSGNDVSPMSAAAQVTTPPMPAAPASVAATVNSSTQVTVTWSESIPPNGLPIQYYFVFRGTSPTGLTKVTTKTGLQFIDTTAAANTTYYYAIESVDTGDDVSPVSANAQASTT